LHGVFDRLHLDPAIVEDERVEPVIDVASGVALGLPLQVKDIIGEDRVEIPRCTGNIAQ
jgi:hypothetical protein